ncbi:MAG: hypothetical protein AAFR21_08495 [Pseudomonadota bacterium]
MKPKPRIAFSGEEYGFGYQATNQFISTASRHGTADGGYSVSQKTTNITEIGQRERDSRFHFDINTANRQPLRSKEQALLAVKQGTADFAVVPFYSPYTGYDFESLRAISNLFTLMGVEQVEATDHYCLAVYEPQVLDLVQSSHPGSALSSLLASRRNTYGSNETVRSSFGEDVGRQSFDDYRADLNIDQAGQFLLRNRVDMVFCGPDAARRCKSKLDGLRAAGVDVAETLRSVEPHREMARLARTTLDRDRQVNTFFDPRSATSGGSGVNFVSTMSSQRQDAPLYAAVLPFEVAMRTPEFTIIDDDLEDTAPTKTRFLVVGPAPDETLYEDAYRTTDAKTRYWMQRLRDVKNDAHQRFDIDDLNHDRENGPGVRVMLRFRRSEDAASIGDVEDYLRNYGVRHAVTRIDEDSERSNPAGIVLDMEFSCADFDDDISYRPEVGLAKWGGTALIAAVGLFALAAIYNVSLLSNPIAAVTQNAWPVAGVFGVVTLVSMFWLGRFRRVRGSVVNGALKKAFARWKNRGVIVLAAVPFAAPQLPRHARRRWYLEMPRALAADAIETWFVRLSRLLIPAIGIGLLGLFAYALLINLGLVG